MEHRLTIDRITPQTKEWTSKVQLIEKPRPQQSKDGKTRFQIAVVRDEREEQVAAVLYGEDVEKYADKLTPFSTYLISTAKVRVPLPYGVPISHFEWVIDKFTVVKEVKDDNIQDPPLLPPTRLNTVPFAYLHEQQRNTEFDILAIVVNCGSIKYVGANNSKCREVVVMDTNMRPTILTMWEDFADTDGSILATQIAEYPIIVAKRITRASYGGLSLSTRYNSVILINPPYAQVGRLLNWVKDNRPRLMRHSQQTGVDSSLVLATEQDDIVPIAAIQSQPHIQLFYVEAKLSFPTADQDFYELLCSHCGQQYRTHSPKIIHCASCKQCAMLTPRAPFEIVMTDGSGSTVAILIGELGEKFLDMTAIDICEISAKKQPLPLQHVRHRLPDKVFKIQLRKIFSRTSDPRLFIISYSVKEDLFQLPVPVASAEIGESSCTKLENAELNKEIENEHNNQSNVEQVTPIEEVKNELTTEGGSSSKRQQTELETPPKKK